MNNHDAFKEFTEKLNHFWMRKDLDGVLLFLDDNRTRITEPFAAFIKAKFFHQHGKISSAIRELGKSYDDSPSSAFLYGRLKFEAGLINEAVTIWEPHWRNFSYESGDLQVYLQCLLVSDLSLPELYEKHSYWASQVLNRIKIPSSCSAAPPPHNPSHQINLAYFATSWDGTTIRRSFTNQLQFHDRRKFKVFGYSSLPIPTDLVNKFDEVRVVGGSDSDLITQASKDNIHIFLDTTGITPGCRFSAMASRVAPIQYNYLNHLFSTCLPNIDFMIGDNIAPSEDHLPFYSESISRINGCSFSFFYEDEIAYKEVPPCLSNGHVTFGSLSSYHKITEHCVSAWCDILKVVPNSRFILRSSFFDQQENLDLFFRRLRPHGIDPSRFILLKSCSHLEIMETYSMIDIALDTLPYNGGNTTCEALWQGVPVITAFGNSWSGQYGSSILINSGLPEFAAKNVDEYKNIAVRLANDSQKLTYYRKNMRALIRNSLFNSGRSFAGRLEALFIRDLLANHVSSFAH
jgi:protein O-GlcNAc transferase